MHAVQNGPLIEISEYEGRGLAYGALCVVAAVVLWLGAAIIAKRLVPSVTPSDTRGITAHSFSRTLVALLGLWLAIDSGRSLVWYSMREVVPWRDGDGFNASQITTSHAADMISATIVGAFGLWMLLRPGVLAARIAPRADGSASDC